MSGLSIRHRRDCTAKFDTIPQDAEDAFSQTTQATQKPRFGKVVKMLRRNALPPRCDTESFVEHVFNTLETD